MNMTPTDPEASNPTPAKTANEAAALLFPKIAPHFPAFFERETETNHVPSIQLMDLSEEFWALSLGILGNPENPIVYVPSEAQFRRYHPDKGIYEPIAEALVTSGILGNLEMCAALFPPHVQIASFLQLKNRGKLKGVVERAKDLLLIQDDFFQDRRHLDLACKNGTLRLDTHTFQPSTSQHPLKETLPLNYDPQAPCNLFLNSFLNNILEPHDIDLLQRYCSQILEGINHSQTILVLTGDAGWGKSSLVKILGTMVGWNNVGIIREQVFKDEFELAHYSGKHFLFHPDMPTDFLDRKEASLFKQLVGGDPLWANMKKEDGRKVVHGNFPIILACNGKPQIHLDQDTDAWLRRLVVISFKSPTHEQHFGKLAEMILTNESAGILNWLLEGRKKLGKSRLQLTQTPEQKARAATLLMSSDSPRAFVRCKIVKKKEGQMGVVELYEHYQKWCRDNHIRPFASKGFSKIVKEEIEINLGIKSRHDLPGETGKPRRGWKGLGFVELETKSEAGKMENTSSESA